MATKKISELTEVTSPIASDVFPIVNDGETKKVQLTNIKTILGIEDLNTRLTTAETNQGALTSLTTTEKTNLVGAINEVDANITNIKGNLSWINNLPANFTDTAGLIGFTTKSIENGILTGDASAESFQTSLTCNVMINYNQAIAHSSTPDSYNLELFADGVSVGIIGSAYIPASVTASVSISAMVNLTAGVTYTLKIKANGTSGTHTPEYTYSTNKTNIWVVA